MRDTIQKAIIGVASPVVGVSISLSTVEIWLRILSLSAGLLVSILMCISIGLSIRRKLREQNGHGKTHSAPDEEPTTTL